MPEGPSSRPMRDKAEFAREGLTPDVIVVILSLLGWMLPSIRRGWLV
jgi:hypothetical protein